MGFLTSQQKVDTGTGGIEDEEEEEQLLNRNKRQDEAAYHHSRLVVTQMSRPRGAQQMIQTMEDLRDEQRSMNTMPYRVVGESDSRQAQETARRHSNNVYTRGERNVVLQPGQSSRQHDDSDSDSDRPVCMFFKSDADRSCQTNAQRGELDNSILG